MNAVNIHALECARSLQRKVSELALLAISAHIELMGHKNSVTRQEVEKATKAAMDELKLRTSCSDKLSALREKVVEAKKDILALESETLEASDGTDALRRRMKETAKADGSGPYVRWSFLATAYPELGVVTSKVIGGGVSVNMSGVQFWVTAKGEVSSSSQDSMEMLKHMWQYPDAGPALAWAQPSVPTYSACQAISRRVEGQRCIANLNATRIKTPPGAAEAFTAQSGKWYCVITVPPEYPHRPSCVSLSLQDPFASQLTVRTTTDPNAYMYIVLGSPATYDPQETLLLDVINAHIVSFTGDVCPGGIDPAMVQHQLDHFLTPSPRPEIPNLNPHTFCPLLTRPNVVLRYNSRINCVSLDVRGRFDNQWKADEGDGIRALAQCGFRCNHHCGCRCETRTHVASRSQMRPQ